jgi:predicted PurR-regulated permease PerM
MIDDVSQAATPLAPPGGGGKARTSPSSTTKFIERSLHDLDDLIQQRRLELSALRKSNRKRLNEQFSATVSLIELVSIYIFFIFITFFIFIDRERHL